MKRLILLFTLLPTILSLTHAQEVCLDQEEIALGNMINKMRLAEGLSPVSLSTSLTYVADVHTKDLYLNYNPFGRCSLHSWSDKGRWKPCCIIDDDLQGMYDKPYELTKYKSKGYEAVYYENTEITSGLVMEAWSRSEAVKDLILQRGKYQKMQWNAMGVAIFEGYACVWFGQLLDKAGEPMLCSAQQQNISSHPKPQTNTKGYFVIMASLSNEKDATTEKKRLEHKGHQIVLLHSGNNYRLGIGPFQTSAEAEEARKKITGFKGTPWIHFVKE